MSAYEGRGTSHESREFCANRLRRELSWMHKFRGSNLWIGTSGAEPIVRLASSAWDGWERPSRRHCS